MDNINAYTVRIEWSEEDDCYLARYLELPSLITHGDTKSKALEELELAAAEAITWMKEDGEAIPEPLSLKPFKGNISLRIPPDTHRKIAYCAAEQKVSVNQFITTLIENGLYTDQMKNQIEALQNENHQLSRIVEHIMGISSIMANHGKTDMNVNDAITEAALHAPDGFLITDNVQNLYRTGNERNSA